jgi:hypothetical protein
MRNILLAGILLPLSVLSAPVSGFGQTKSPSAHDAKCDVNWTAPPLDQLTPGIVATPLPGGKLVMYTVRVEMHTPEGNISECSVRQYRFHLPLLQNTDGTGSGPVPQIQLTIESPDAIGAGVGLIFYSDTRFEENGFSALLIDAQTPASVQSPSHYFANLTVIGQPASK